MAPAHPGVATPHNNLTAKEPDMGKQYITLVLIAFLSTCFVMCSPKKEPLKIGLAVTLTGTSSTFGANMRNGALLAVEEANMSGGVNGRPVELIIKDDKLDSDEALKVDRELIDEGVVAILGHYLSSIAVKAVPLINEKKIVMVGATVSTAELSGIDDYFFRLIGAVDQQSKVVSRLINDRLDVKKIAVVYDLSNANYTESYYRFFKKDFEKTGGEIIAVPFDSRKAYSAPDIAETLITSDAKGLFLITNAIHGALICQHLRKKGSEIPIVGCQWNFSDPNFIRNGGKAVEGVISINAYNGESRGQRYLRYKKTYESRFGGKASMADQMGYDAARFLLEALSKSDTPEHLKHTLVNMKVFQGVDGDIFIDRFGDANRDMYMLEIENGEIRTKGKIAGTGRADKR